jgi:hypothetical protein
MGRVQVRHGGCTRSSARGYDSGLNIPPHPVYFGPQGTPASRHIATKNTRRNPGPAAGPTCTEMCFVNTAAIGNARMRSLMIAAVVRPKKAVPVPARC